MTCADHCDRSELQFILRANAAVQTCAMVAMSDSHDTTAHDRALVSAALEHDPAASRELVSSLSPVVRQRVTRVLLQRQRKLGRTPTPADIDDLHHDVFVLLFDRGARVLRAWDPARGLSLRNFVGLVAEREALAITRSGRRSAWAEHPTADELLVATDVQTPEREAAAREELSLLLEQLRERLSPRGQQMFEALYSDQQSVEHVCERFSVTANAVYTFRSRLQNMLEQIKLGLSVSESDAAQLRARAPMFPSKRATP